MTRQHFTQENHSKYHKVADFPGRYGTKLSETAFNHSIHEAAHGPESVNN